MYKTVRTVGRWQRWPRWLGVPVALVLALGALLLATPTATIVRADGPFFQIVNSTADTGGSCLGLPTCTLRQAVNESNANDPGAGAHNTIIFAAGVTGTITLGNGPLTLTRDVVINGPGARELTVAGRPSFMVNAGVTASISGLTISGAGYNLSNYGIENNGTLTVTSSTVTDNTYGISNNNQGTLTVTSSTFSNNTKAIINPSGTMTVTNSTFSGNTNDGIVSDGTLTVTNSTLSRNLGEGIVNNGGTLTVRNSIVAFNGYGNDNIYGNFTDGGHNITSGDPKLGPLADNGGPTNTMLPLPGSPALDAGGTAANGCPATDQRGVTRPQGIACDIGAVEVPPGKPLSLVVGSTADTDGSCPTATTCTLRQAVNDSNTNDPGVGKQNTITFAAGVTGTITRVNGALTLTRNVAIMGPGARALAVAGPAANFGVNAGVMASFSGITFTESCVGIVNMGGTLTVANSTFSGNTGATCAGIVNDGTLTVTNSTFTNNYKGINIDSGTATVTNSTFSGNTGARGGNSSAGIQNQGTLTVTNSTVSGNTTGIINFDTMTVRNSIVAGNTGANIVGNFADGGHNLTGGDPKLGPLADNGGPTDTIPLLPGSPAIDAGGTAANGCPATDQRGVTRPQGSACDIGAVEVVPGKPLTLVVGSTADTGGSCPTATTCTLRQAVNTANQTYVDVGKHNTITFAAGVTGTITLGNGPLTLTQDVVITGPGARVLTVADPADGQSFGVNAGVTASISGLTIKGASFADIENEGTLTVTESTFNGTSTDSIINSGTLTVTNSTFSGNADNFFGTTGISNFKSNSALTVTNSTFSGKSYGIKNNGTLTMTNGTVSGNSVGISNVERDGLSVRNSIVAGNTGANIQGSFTDGGHNLTGGDPKLGPLADNGGPTDTMLPLPGSPTLDAGGTAANGCPATDQRGITRPQGAECDIGAVEVAGAAAPLVITLAPPSLPSGTAGAAYSNTTITASGGVAPYTFMVTTGALPDGLTLDTTGMLHGTPTQADAFTVTVTATDAHGSTGTRQYTLSISRPVIILSPASLPDGVKGVAYPSQTITASGGAAPATFAVTAGALPAGLTLARSGTLSGTPAAEGIFTFTITATEANGSTGSRQFTVTISAASLVSIAVTPANATLKVGATQQYTATGTYADNSTADITNQVTWTSDAPKIATVERTGNLTGKGPGTAHIAATQGSVRDQATITVTAGSPPEIAPVPASASRPDSAGTTPVEPSGTTAPAPTPESAPDRK